MKVAIIGGTGLIGKKLYKSLVEDGHTIFLFARDVTKYEDLESEKVRVIPLNPLNLKEALEESDAVINLAGANIYGTRWTESFKKEIRSSRIDTTRLVVDTINSLEKKPEILINSSATGYYENTVSEKVITEQDNNGQDFLSLVCRDWENEAVKANCKVCIVRTAIVLDRKQGAYPKIVQPYKSGVGIYIKPGKQMFSWIHIEDLISVFKFVLANKMTGPVNASSPEPLSYDQMHKTLKSVYKPIVTIPVPIWASHLALGEISHYLINGANVYPKVLIDKQFEFHYKDFSSVVKAFQG